MFLAAASVHGAESQTRATPANRADQPTASAFPTNGNRLLAHWQLTEDCQDSSGNTNHAQNHGVTFAADGPIRAARFDGRKSWLEVSPAPSLRLGTNDFTIAAWVDLSMNLRSPQNGRAFPLSPSEGERAGVRGPSLSGGSRASTLGSRTAMEDGQSVSNVQGVLSPEAGQDDSCGDIVSQYDPAARRGFNLRITHNSGVTTSQPNTRQVHFGIDNAQLEPQWTDHGRPGHAVMVFALAAHDGHLYAGTCEPGREQAGHLYQFDGATNWIDCGSPDPCNTVSSLAVSAGRLYAGVSKYRLAGSALPESENPHLGGRVYRYAGGQSWQDCGQLPNTEAIGGLVVYRGRLYASSMYMPAGFFRYEEGRRWTSLPTPDGKRVEAICVYDGQLFASSYNVGHVFRYDGAGWTDCGQVGPAGNVQTYSFAIHEGRLFVGTWNTGHVFRYRGDNDWEDMGRLGSELEVMGMLVHNGKLFAGSLPHAEVYRFDGPGTWTKLACLDATPNVLYRRAWSMAEFQGRLFCGTLPSGHVFSLEAGKNATCDRELSPGRHHLAAIRQHDRLLLYLDGKLVATSARFDPAAYDLSTGQPLKIGFGPNDYFRGSLRDLRLYAYALSPREVAHLAR